MKKGISILQIVIFALCGIGVVLAVLMFSDKISIGKKAGEKIQGNITMWGTLPYFAIRPIIDSLQKPYPDVQVNYLQKDSAVMRADLVDALASGRGPDLITVTPADVIANRELVMAIPYDSMPQSTYLSVFVDGSSNFLTDKGVFALPMTIDPMVMYYNRDLLTSSYTLNPPATWNDVITLGESVTQKTDAGALSVSTVALGTYDNIRRAKEILSVLFLQSSNKLVVFDPGAQWYRSTFSEGPAVSNAFSFYTSFSNGANERYSWSAGLPTDRDQFVAGKLALYFGYASELIDIRKRNPNLNFDIAMMPQPANATKKVTYGAMTGISVVKMSKNPTLAILVAQEFVKASSITQYLLNDPTAAPARRDLLGVDNDDARRTLIYRSAIISQAWLDPDPVQTNNLFRKYIGEINAGSATPDTIMSAGEALFSSILNKAKPPEPATDSSVPGF